MGTQEIYQELPGKPIPLRAIFILNALMGVLPFIFYVVVSQKGIAPHGIEPIWMLYTGFAYLASFALMVTAILKRNYNILRTVILFNILIAIPAKAFIGIAVAMISFGLTFNEKVKSYFLVG